MDIFREFTFEAAHRLPNVGAGHKCANLHGHSYRVIVTVSGDVDAHTGMVVDFGFLKSKMAPVLADLDHHTLNDVVGLENPTAENLAYYIWNRLFTLVPESVTVWETAHAGATYRGGR